MKLFIASDIHGSAYYCRQMLEAYEREKADRMLLLGDILYHGPRNDLPREYAPKEVIEMLNAHKGDILCVRGNCDTEVDQMVLEFPILADYAFLVVDGYTIYATHGHVFNAAHRPPMHPGDILLQGHTHVPTWKDRVFNPGSISIPKENSEQGYMTLKDGVFRWKTLEGVAYHIWSDDQIARTISRSEP